MAQKVEKIQRRTYRHRLVFVNHMLPDKDKRERAFFIDSDKPDSPFTDAVIDAIKTRLPNLHIRKKFYADGHYEEKEFEVQNPSRWEKAMRWLKPVLSKLTIKSPAKEGYEVVETTTKPKEEKVLVEASKVIVTVSNNSHLAYQKPASTERTSAANAARAAINKLSPTPTDKEMAAMLRVHPDNLYTTVLLPALQGKIRPGSAIELLDRHITNILKADLRERTEDRPKAVAEPVAAPHPEKPAPAPTASRTTRKRGTKKGERKIDAEICISSYRKNNGRLAVAWSYEAESGGKKEVHADELVLPADIDDFSRQVMAVSFALNQIAKNIRDKNLRVYVEAPLHLYHALSSEELRDGGRRENTEGCLMAMVHFDNARRMSNELQFTFVDQEDSTHRAMEAVRNKAKTRYAQANGGTKAAQAFVHMIGPDGLLRPDAFTLAQ